MFLSIPGNSIYKQVACNSNPWGLIHHDYTQRLKKKQPYQQNSRLNYPNTCWQIQFTRSRSRDKVILFCLQIKQEHSTYHGDVPSSVAFRRFWFIHIGHTSINHSRILLNLVKLIIISGMLWNKHTRCSVLEYQLVNTKFSLAHGYSWCKYFLPRVQMCTVLLYGYMWYLYPASKQYHEYQIIPLIRSTLLLVCNKVVEVIRKDLYLARLRKLPDEYGPVRIDVKHF